MGVKAAGGKVVAREWTLAWGGNPGQPRVGSGLLKWGGLRCRCGSEARVAQCQKHSTEAAGFGDVGRGHEPRNIGRL